MMVVRPSRASDLPGLLELANLAGVGLTTLPDSEAVLAEHISDSERSFARDVRQPKGERYLFVMEDLLTGQIAGCAGLVGRVGGFDPFYSYALKSHRKMSQALGVDFEVQALHLIQNHKGPSEIGTLFMRPEQRKGGHGRLMSLSRFLFVGAQPHRFANEIIAEMRGNADLSKGSPFWDAVGRHFFDMAFVDADKRSASKKQFIADLMPQHPIYVSMLPSDAQAVIGQVHPETEPAVRLLAQEGFVFGDEVDIFDAGPLYRAAKGEIRSIRDAEVMPFAKVIEGALDGPLMLLSNTDVDFRCCLGRVTTVEDGGVALNRGTALALGLRIGAQVRMVSARP
ncbi:MAG: arginine N-succinyltransferase [Myxococcota bacterium]|nr:arginine N-succinyltransferase [Myxococcota bacterium]